MLYRAVQLRMRHIDFQKMNLKKGSGKWPSREKILTEKKGKIWTAGVFYRVCDKHFLDSDYHPVGSMTKKGERCLFFTSKSRSRPNYNYFIVGTTDSQVMSQCSDLSFDHNLIRPTCRLKDKST